MATLSPLFTWRSAIACKGSGLSPTQRHVALTLSLYMAERGGGTSIPSQAALAEDTGLSERAVRSALVALQDGGWLRVAKQPPDARYRGKTDRYETVVPFHRQEVPVGNVLPVSDPPHRQEVPVGPPAGGSGVSLRSSSEEKERTETKEREKSSALRETGSRPRNPVWDELVLQCGEPGTPTAKGLYGKACRELTEAVLGSGAKPAPAAAMRVAEEVAARCRRYRTGWPGMDLTVTALMARWPTLGQPLPVAGSKADQRQEDIIGPIRDRAIERREREGKG